MNAKETYESILMKTFMINKDDVETASTKNVQAWDSVGKLSLVTELEEAFDIELETEDIIGFNSYQEGLAILRKHNIEL